MIAMKRKLHIHWSQSLNIRCSLTCTATIGPSGPGSNGNKGVTLYISDLQNKSLNIRWSLMSHSARFWEVFPICQRCSCILRWTLTCTAIIGPSGPGSNDNEGVTLHFSDLQNKSLNIRGSLMSHSAHSWEVFSLCQRYSCIFRWSI